MNKNTAIVVAVVVLVLITSFIYMGRSSTTDENRQAPATSTGSTTNNDVVGSSNTVKPRVGSTAKPSTTKPVVQPSITYPNTVTLSLNQEGEFPGGLKIKPEVVLEDSRCPKGVQCVWEGALLVNTHLVAGGGSFNFSYTLGKPEATVGGWTITLVSAEPDPIVAGKIDPNSYRLTYKAEKGN